MRGRQGLLVLLAAIMPLVFMWQTLLLGRPLIRDDASLFFYPQFFRLAEATRQGELYLWDAQQFAGMPALAAGQAGSLYLPHLLAFRLLPWLTAVHALYWLHLVVALLGFVWVSRRLGAGRGGAVVGGMIYAFSGYQGAHLIHYSFVVAVAWLPVLLGLLQKALAEHRACLWGLWALAMAAGFMAAAPQLLLMALVVCGLWLGLGGWWREPGVAVGGRLWAVVGAGGLTTLLVMPQLLPMIELLRQLGEVDPAGPGGGTDFMASYSFRLTDLVRVVAGGFYGNVQNAITGGGPLFHETAAFVGAGPLLLALAGLLVARGWRGLGFTLAVFGLGAFLMWAEGNPVYSLLAQVPVLRDFRAMGRWALLPILAVSLWAALAVTALPRVSERLRWRALRVVAAVSGSLLFLLVMLWATFGAEGGRLVLPGHPGAAVVARTPAAAIYNFLVGWEPVLLGLALVLSVAGVWLLSVGRRTPALVTLLLAVGPPLWLFWQANNLVAGREFYAASPPAAEVIEAHGQGRMVYIAPALVEPGDAAGSGPRAGDPRPGWGDRLLLTPRLGLVYGMHYADGYIHRLSTPSTYRLWQDYYRYSIQSFTGQMQSSEATVVEVGTPLERMKRCHQLVGAQYIVTTGELRDPELPLVAELPARVYRYARPHPRAWLVSRVRVVAEPPGQLRAVKLRGFEPGREAVVDRAVAGLSGGSAPGAAEIVEARDQRVVVAVRAREAAVLVLADAWYPGWEVRVNGHPATLLRANFAVRAVAVPAGDSQVEFRYRPWPFRLGLMLMALGLAVVAGLAVAPNLAARGRRAVP